MALIRAIYRDGNLQLLDNVNLSEGQEVHLQIVDNTLTIHQALSDLIAETPAENVASVDDRKLQKLIDDATKGVTLSDIIVEERSSGR